MNAVAVAAVMVVIFSIVAFATIAYVALREDEQSTTRAQELRVIITSCHNGLRLPIEEMYPDTHRTRDVVFNMVESGNIIQVRARSLTRRDLKTLRREGVNLHDRCAEVETKC